ncbi:LuxR family transcriptional regulator [Prosthecodimorpha staleyi]|uniref:LuxR family transcriptional regulator n=1 Tax=Prosthecodimorpha staleyi TaxID=2840188 RepID=A0A947D7G0_9HYPH|nr:LuxR family transcriptional regulator [Prosthecodimorpha staleyi]MBT9291504.1 LuxR family transcriptional regulator [Prosthecodimorpha staleyi]
MSAEQYALDVVERLRISKDYSSVIGELSKVMSDFGFNSVVVTGLPRPGEMLDTLLLSANWPEAWGERYLAKKYDQVDPTVKRVRMSLQPFRWSDVREQTLSAVEKKILDEATEFGLNDGIAVPIHDLNGLEAGVSFGTDRLLIDSRAQAALHLISIYAYECLRRQAPDRSGGQKPIHLSRRERECIQWTAAGKTSWEIGQIIGVSEATVNEYLYAAARRLNTRTRPQLIARCMREGLIN